MKIIAFETSTTVNSDLSSFKLHTQKEESSVLIRHNRHIGPVAQLVEHSSRKTPAKTNLFGIIWPCSPKSENNNLILSQPYSNKVFS